MKKCETFLMIFKQCDCNFSFSFQMLVVFKSAPILKRTLKVKHAMMQLYVLKLLKMQTKYLGRQWRKSNMKTMSAIYTKVRHRLNDDWAYGNGKKKFFHSVSKMAKIVSFHFPQENSEIFPNVWIFAKIRSHLIFGAKI